MLAKKCIRSLKKNIKKDVRVTFVVTYHTTKSSSYTNTKDCIDKLAHHYIVYKLCCPGCSNSYIGKTERTYLEWVNDEHVFKDKNSVVCNYVNNCAGVKFLADLLNIDPVQTIRDKFDKKIHSIATVKENISMIDRARQWKIILFKEALHIKGKNRALNKSIKASKKLKPFKVITNWLILLFFVCLITFIVTYRELWSLYSDDEIVNNWKYTLL